MCNRAFSDISAKNQERAAGKKNDFLIFLASIRCGGNIRGRKAVETQFWPQLALVHLHRSRLAGRGGDDSFPPALLQLHCPRRHRPPGSKLSTPTCLTMIASPAAFNLGLTHFTGIRPAVTDAWHSSGIRTMSCGYQGIFLTRTVHGHHRGGGHRQGIDRCRPATGSHHHLGPAGQRPQMGGISQAGQKASVSASAGAIDSAMIPIPFISRIHPWWAPSSGATWNSAKG